ncbi:LOW QUALITY PROTEIN: zinc finger MYM-type protein 1-like [Dioscorea cayenensis subsp. rotundata]|uniref:LOW QUALITY PROTEIN: zinc finger MYM-type protein 1-like n=1 Tax=Dioscorea cayennensis subsp. rotundata TaxID=55577 RepID=A0AB40CU20_DIOCR|nr:LOW QUALITY PROTEIN: zinc finger MYM-type protein 1-like [Dioscorea cayenensis subsp. rotundata]
MEKYFKRKSLFEESSSTPENSDEPQITQQYSKQAHVEVDLKNLPADPGLRPLISTYHPNDQDKVRRAYLQKGPCQPRNHNFPQTSIGNVLRRFNPSWFDEYGNWLEYSIAKDAAFCLYCYLFKPDIRKQGSADSFVIEGFTNWNKKDRLKTHIGGLNSAHNQAYRKCQDLMNQNQNIQSILIKQGDQARSEYRTRLTASVDCLRFLLRQGLPFRGHDESEESNNQGNFLELLHFLAKHNEAINSVVLKNAPSNLKLTAHDIQNDIISAAASETTKAIINELGDDLFAILVDESRDVSNKEQMALVLRYMNNKGCIVERFLAIVHVSDTTALSLKEAIESIFSKYGLSLSRLRGQGYDGASNMRGEFNGLKSLILKENEFAFYIHCFAHQLQLTLVAVAKNEDSVASLFQNVSCLLNVVGASCKRYDILRESQASRVAEALKNDELASGKGLNQEISLKRAGDTRWGSHYGTLLNLIILFPSVIDVLENVGENGLNSEQRVEAQFLLQMLQSFDFIFNLHLMRNVLGITNELSKSLQRKDQDIVNAMELVKISKQRLQMMRDDGWDLLLHEILSFCGKYSILVPSMDEKYSPPGRSRRKVVDISNLHHYRVELFNVVIDRQLQELNNRFTEINTELLLCATCLNPSDSFSAFNKEKLIRFARFYPLEFSVVDVMGLDSQLETYIIDMRSNLEFSGIKEIGQLTEKLVETKKNIVYPLVFLLAKLASILPVATASVERTFSAMKIVKNRLRNRMGDNLMNDCLVTYIERDIFNNIDNETIIQRFQNMKSRRGQL